MRVFEQSSIKRKLLTRKKLVKSIDTCLEEGNFSPVDLSTRERKGFHNLPREAEKQKKILGKKK